MLFFLLGMLGRYWLLTKNSQKHWTTFITKIVEKYWTTFPPFTPLILKAKLFIVKNPSKRCFFIKKCWVDFWQKSISSKRAKKYFFCQFVARFSTNSVSTRSVVHCIVLSTPQPWHALVLSRLSPAASPKEESNQCLFRSGRDGRLERSFLVRDSYTFDRLVID